MYTVKYSQKKVEEKLDNNTASIEELYELTGNLKLEHVKNTRVSYIIDQRGIISDPDSMVKGNYYNHPTLGLIKVSNGGAYGNSKYDFLTWLKENTHAYVAKQIDTGLKLKQLDDTDRRKFADGSSSIDYINGTIENCDVFIKFPCDIYYKCEPIITDENPTLNNDYVLITLAKELEEGEDEGGWNKYSQYNLIGVYPSCKINDKLYSISDIKPTSNSSKTQFITYAKNRGSNFDIYDYDSAKIMSLLFYGYYNSLNCREICGYGTINSTNNSNVYPKINGLNNGLGMIDTDSNNGNGADTPNEDQIIAGTGSDIKTINFWGLESYWGDLEEWIGNMYIMKAFNSNSGSNNPYWYVADYIEKNGFAIITRSDGDDIKYLSKEAFLADYTTSYSRFIAIKNTDGKIIRFVDIKTNLLGCIKQMIFGTYVDILPKIVDTQSLHTYFSDNVTFNEGDSILRSGYSNRNVGISSYFTSDDGITPSVKYFTTRLCYKGNKNDIYIINDETETL